MREWSTLYQKEMLESWRNYKWVWFPLIMIVLAILDPITTYYLPVILDSAGNLPDGAVFEMPTPLPHEAFFMSVGQLGSLGILIIVLVSMGMVANERKSGVAELILVKPINYKNYLTAKLFAQLTIVWVSLFLALLASWYYVNLLFGELSFTSVLITFFFYGLWLTFILSIVLFFNTLFKQQGLIAFFSLGIIIILSIITPIFGKSLAWSPNHLASYLQEYLILQEVTNDLLYTAGITLGLSFLITLFSFYTFRVRD